MHTSLASAPPCRYRIGAALQKLPSSVRSRRCRTFLGRAAFGGICPVISVVTIIHTMVTRVNRKDPNFSLILQRIKNHMRKKAYDSVIQSKKNRSGTGDVGKKQCCTRRTPLLRLTLLYRKNRLHYGKRFHTNCYLHQKSSATHRFRCVEKHPHTSHPGGQVNL